MIVAHGTPGAVKHSKTPDELALHKLCPDIVKDLDIKLILPYLHKYNLLSQPQYEKLNLDVTRSNKALHLVMWLPQSHAEFLNIFMSCLRDSAGSNKHHQHYTLAEQLKEERDKATRMLHSGEDFLELQSYGMLLFKIQIDDAY